jgi:hypothetical protein
MPKIMFYLPRGFDGASRDEVWVDIGFRSRRKYWPTESSLKRVRNLFRSRTDTRHRGTAGLWWSVSGERNAYPLGPQPLGLSNTNKVPPVSEKA